MLCMNALDIRHKIYGMCGILRIGLFNLCRLLFVFLFATTAYAQQPEVPSLVQTMVSRGDTLRLQRPMVALVLSGGGAKGITHVGALQALEDLNIPIDLVVGTSMGAVVGGLYALGYSPDSLAQIAVTQKWGELLTGLTGFSARDVAEVSLPEHDAFAISFPIGQKSKNPSGLLSSQRLDMLLSRLLIRADSLQDFMNLPTPFACTGADVETGQARLFTSGSLHQSIRASMAIPGVFSPVEIDGRYYFDGGVARNLPVKEAFQMGADVVIAVDVGWQPQPMSYVKNFSDLMNQAIGFWMEKSIEEDRRQATILIRPDVTGYGAFSFEDPNLFIERGRMATDALRSSLEALRDSLGLTPQPRSFSLPINDHNLNVQKINVSVVNQLDEPTFIRERILQRLPRVASTRILEDLVLFHFQIKNRENFDLQVLSDGVDRIMSSGHFGQVSYRFSKKDSISTLTLEAIRQNNSILGLGARFDQPSGPALMAGLRLDGMLQSAPVRMEIRGVLNKNWYIQVVPSVMVAGNPVTQLSYMSQLSRNYLKFPSQIEKTAEFHDVVEAFQEGGLSVALSSRLRLQFHADLATYFERVSALGGRFGQEKHWGGLRIGTSFKSALRPNEAREHGFYTIDWSLMWGLAPEQNGEKSYFQGWFSQSGTYLPFPSVQLTTDFQTGFTLGDSAPLYRRFYLGGFTRNYLFGNRHAILPGHPDQAYWGNYLKSGTIGLNYRVYRQATLGILASAGHLSNASFFDTEVPIKWGIGVVAGYSLDRIGPIRMGFVTDFSSVRPVLSIGHVF